MKFVLKEKSEEVIFNGTMVEYVSGFDVKAYQILKAFKGDTEITGAKLEKMKEGFIGRGYIKLRPFERILFDVGFTIDTTELGKNLVLKLSVTNNNELAINKGLFTYPGIIDGEQELLGVMLYNSTPFLNKIEKNEKIAKFIPIFASTKVEGWD